MVQLSREVLSEVGLKIKPLLNLVKLHWLSPQIVCLQLYTIYSCQALPQCVMFQGPSRLRVLTSEALLPDLSEGDGPSRHFAPPPRLRTSRPWRGPSAPLTTFGSRDLTLSLSHFLLHSKSFSPQMWFILHALKPLNCIHRLIQALWFNNDIKHASNAHLF